MGKITCQECKKTCKGQAVRLQDKYFHAKCFKCKECKKQLAAGGFYAKDDAYYCAEDYQRLFGTKCAACHKYVEGEVVTALGNTYHQDCFHCTKCGGKFGAGDKVTFNGKDYLCNKCLDQEEAKKSPSKKGKKGALVTSTPARPVQDGTQNGDGDGLDNPFRVMLYQEDGPYTGPLSPISLNSQDSFSPSEGVDQDTPDGTANDQSNKDGRLSPIQQIGSASSYETRFDVDYGKFYKQSFLKQVKEPIPYKKGPSWNPPPHYKSPDFHRPDNFSYTQVRKDFIIPMRKGMESQYMTKRKMEDIVPMNNDEAIKLSKIPDATKHEVYRPPPIERDDWPAPPAAVSTYPHLFREHPPGTVRARNEEPEYIDDEKLDRDIEELSKLQKSGVGQEILKDLERAKKRSKSPPLDPRSASRTPSANKEPIFKTRYESPIFASPSRDLDYRPRTHSMDDEILEFKKYRTSTLPISNFPAPKPGYGLKGKASTLPADTRNGGYFDGMEDEERRPRRAGESGDEGDTDLERRSYYTSNSSMEEYDPETGLRKSRYRFGNYFGSSSLHKPSYMAFRRSMPSVLRPDEPPQIYPFEQLKITNFRLPPGVDRNTLEQHLDRIEFESIFHMPRDQFYRLAEWKRNDLKKRVGLF